MREHIHIALSPDKTHKIALNPGETGSYLQDKLHGKATLSTGDNPPPETTILVEGHPLEEHLALSHLKTLVIPFTGVPIALIDRLRKRPDITVYNMHFQAEIVAEGAMVLLLAVSRNLCRNDREMRLGRWPARGDEPPPPSLHGKTAVVFGMGAIGREIARLCSLFDMQIIGVTRSGKCKDDAFPCYPVESLREILPKADVLFISTPLTAQTRGIIGGAELALLKDRSMIVNIARAEIIQEEPLYSVLSEAKIFGAGLDVWWTSFEVEGPAFFHFPFNKLDNVILSPHITWRTEKTEDLRYEVLANLLSRILNGDPPPPVDLEAGY